MKADTGEVYMTFKLLKRRYRSSETDEKLKRLDYESSSNKTSLIAGISRQVYSTLSVIIYIIETISSQVERFNDYRTAVA